MEAEQLVDGERAEAAAMAEAEMLILMRQQTVLMEEIRNQFAEHLELLREILGLLMAERR